MHITAEKRKQVRRRRHEVRFVRHVKLFLKATLWSFIAVTALLLGSLVAFRFIDPPIWSWKLHRDLDPPAGYPAEVHHRWRDISEIPPEVQLAIVASEDQNFPHHRGVDFGAIQQAFDEAEAGKGLRGASTITQQTVKNLYLWPQKAWSRKLLEGGLAMVLDLVWDKRRTLEVYLNIVEFGPGVYGVDAASHYWYRTPLNRLDRNQAARLAAVLPNPWRYRAEPPTAYISDRAAWIEQQMDMLGSEWLRSVQEP